MSFVSYAQNFEDVMLWRALKHIEAGFYIDVGANNPDTDSVTKAFYEHGWSGINIEPVPQWFHRLQKSRLRDINLQLAVGSSPGEITLFEIPDTGLSTAKKNFAERHEAERGYQSRDLKVPVETLTNLCERYHTAPIHFLKIDVEGMEKDVLEGIDFTKVRPWIVLVESILPNRQEECHDEWEPILLGAGYQYAYHDGINRFYVSDEHSELLDAFKYPPNVFDDFLSSQLQEAGSRATNAEKKVQDLDLRLSNAKTEIKEAEAYVRRAETRADKAAARAQKAEARAEQAEAKLREAKTRADQAEIRADEAEAKTRKAETRKEQAEVEAQEAKASARRAEIRARKAATKAQKAKTRADQLATDVDKAETRLRETQERVEQLILQLGRGETQLEQLKEQVFGRNRELEEKQSEIEQLHAHSQWLQNEWEAAKVKIDELNHSSHHWWTIADGLNGELQSIYRSKSWRITWPLRKMMQLLKWLLSLPVRLFRKLIRLPKEIARWLLTTLIIFVLDREQIKNRAKRWLKHHPKLEGRLRAFARARGLIPNYTVSIAQNPGEMKIQTEDQIVNARGSENGLAKSEILAVSLTPRARWIYTQLKTALEEKQEGAN